MTRNYEARSNINNRIGLFCQYLNFGSLNLLQWQVVKCLLFDFGGTLDADGSTWLDRFYPIYLDEGVGASREAFAKAFYASDDALACRFALDGRSLEETLNHQVDCVLENLSINRAGLRQRVVARFLSGCRSHFHRNRPLLERLSSRYRLGIVSNFYGNLDGILRHEGLRDFFAVVADSGVVGSLKPDPGIFMHALEALETTASDCVMVGDSIKRDMRGAEGLKMRHALLSQGPELCCDAAWALKALPELEARLS